MITGRINQFTWMFRRVLLVRAAQARGKLVKEFQFQVRSLQRTNSPLKPIFCHLCLRFNSPKSTKFNSRHVARSSLGEVLASNRFAVLTLSSYFAQSTLFKSSHCDLTTSPSWSNTRLHPTRLASRFVPSFHSFQAHFVCVIGNQKFDQNRLRWIETHLFIVL